MAYRAVLSDPAAVRDELIAVWRRNLPVRGDLDAKLRWLYLDAPAGSGEAFVLRTDEAAVGCAGITARALYSRGRLLRAALLADFAVDRAHRTGLPAVVLQRAVKRHVDAAFDLSYGFPNERAAAIHRWIGYRELGTMARWVRVLRHGGYLARRYGQVPAARLAGGVIDGAKLAVRSVRAAPRLIPARLEWPADVDPRFDRLWIEHRDEHVLLARRDAAMLRWRFLRQPAEQTSIAALVDRRGGALRAYALVRGTAGEMAELVDVFGGIEAIADLFVLLAPALYLRGHTAVGFRFLGDPRLPELLTEHHFSLRDARRAVIANPGARCAIDAATVTDPTAWYITDLDEDT